MRRGLSYLEVLIAAGIALIGMLGAIAIYPVAISNLQKGVTADTTAVIGPSVLESVSILKADQPAQWLFSDAGTLVPVESASYSPRADVQGRKWHASISPTDCLCFDPRYVASVASWDAAQYDPTLFPHIALTQDASPRMRRVTLSRVLGGAAMSTAQARLLFKVQDDLLFERPTGSVTLSNGDVADGATLPAKQRMLDDQRRDYFADYEFVITAVPNTEAREPGPVIIGYEPDILYPSQPDHRRPIFAPYVYDPANVFLAGTGYYDLSVVIFRGRQPDLVQIIDYGGDERNIEAERLCNISFLTAGYGGGDVTVSLRPGRPISDLNIVNSTWALVSGIETVTYTPPAPLTPPATLTRPVFQWYRVAEFSEVYNGDSRDLTLEGADWPANTTNLRCTLVTGVVGVFSKRVQLQ